MSNRLYVGNLSYTTTSEELEEVFAQAGDVVDCTVVTDRETGRSKGFGFVEMADDAAAAAAVQQLNGVEMGGRTLRVEEARPRPARQRW